MHMFVIYFFIILSISRLSGIRSTVSEQSSGPKVKSFQEAIGSANKAPFGVGVFFGFEPSKHQGVSDPKDPFVCPL